MDKPFRETKYTIWMQILMIIALAGILVLLLFACTGCDYAWIHKKDISEFYTQFKAYRNFVEVKSEFDAVLVNTGADNMERTLEAWKGDIDE